jgi:catechol 2,3-dioxygenase-like lactoylglutathione lyase family enzyme
MVLSTRHAGIVVSDIEKSLSFYSGLGFHLVARMVEEGNYIDQLVGLENVKLEWAKLKLPDNSLLELLQYHSHPETSTAKLQHANRLGCSHIAFTVVDIEEVTKYVVGNDGHVRNDYQISPDGKVKVMYCYDPEGNILEIVQELK